MYRGDFTPFITIVGAHFEREGQKFTPQKLTRQLKNNHEGRCIPFEKWWFSSQPCLLVYWRVHHMLITKMNIIQKHIHIYIYIYIYIYVSMCKILAGGCEGMSHVFGKKLHVLQLNLVFIPSCPSKQIQVLPWKSNQHFLNGGQTSKVNVFSYPWHPWTLIYMKVVDWKLDEFDNLQKPSGNFGMIINPYHSVFW